MEIFFLHMLMCANWLSGHIANVLTEKPAWGFESLHERSFNHIRLQTLPAAILLSMCQVIVGTFPFSFDV